MVVLTSSLDCFAVHRFDLVKPLSAEAQLPVANRRTQRCTTIQSYRLFNQPSQSRVGVVVRLHNMAGDSRRVGPSCWIVDRILTYCSGCNRRDSNHLFVCCVQRWLTVPRPTKSSDRSAGYAFSTWQSCIDRKTVESHQMEPNKSLGC